MIHRKIQQLKNKFPKGTKGAFKTQVKQLQTTLWIKPHTESTHSNGKAQYTKHLKTKNQFKITALAIVPLDDIFNFRRH